MKYRIYEMPQCAGGALCLHRGCDTSEKAWEAQKHIFTILFSRQEGSHGNFALSTACYTALHFSAIFLSIVDCVVIEQSWGVPVHMSLSEGGGRYSPL